MTFEKAKSLVSPITSKWSWLLVFFFGLTLTNCTPLASNQSISVLHFINRFDPSSVSMVHAREPEFRICISGDTEDSNIEERSARAALTWLRAIRIVDDRVTDKVVFSCDASVHLTIEARIGGRTSLGSAKWVDSNVSNPYAELLHEMGHAVVGLGDTYAGFAGQCQAGKPESNMCWGGYGPRRDPNIYSGLWEDDIEGTQERYLLLYPDSQAPANASSIDAEAPLDVTNPWPTDGSGSNGTSNNSGSPITVHLMEGKSSTYNYTSYLEVAVPNNINQVRICYGDNSTCLTSQAANAPAAYTRSSLSKSIFKTASTVTVKDGSVVTILGYDSSNTAIPSISRSLRFNVGI